MPPPARPRLTRDRVVAAALALADEQGTQALSMRALARRLRVDPMAVYRHVRDKADLLGAMCDAALAQLTPLDPDGPSEPQVRALARELHALLLRRPALLPVLAGAPVTPLSLVAAQQAVALLVRDGVPEAEAARRFGVVFAYVIGTAMLTIASPSTAEDPAALLDGARELLGDPDPPHLGAAARLLEAPEELEAGLELLLGTVHPGLRALPPDVAG